MQNENAKKPPVAKKENSRLKLKEMHSATAAIIRIEGKNTCWLEKSNFCYNVGAPKKKKKTYKMRKI